MSNDPVPPGDGADDLLGRWLAHHDKPADEADAPPRRVPLAARPSAAAAPVTRLSASAVLAELREAAAANNDRDGLGPVAAPSAFGVRRGQPGSAHSGPSGAPQRGADGETAELDRPSPVGFEPVILASVRKRSEPKEEAEKDRRSRLSRLRSRVAGPAEQPPETDADAEDEPVALYEEPVSFVPPPVFKAPPPPAPVFLSPPAEAPRPTVPYVDMVALSTAASLPATEPDVEPEPEPEPVLPGPDTEPAPVVPEPEPEPEPTPEPVLPGPDTSPSPLSVLPEHQDDGEEPDVPTAPHLEPPATRRLVARTRPPGTVETEDRKRRLVTRNAIISTPTTGTGTAGAARGLLAAARAATPPTKAPPPPRPAPTVAPVPLLPVEKTVEAVPSAPPMEMPAVYEFAPRRSARRFLSMMLIAALVLSGYLGYTAYQSRESIVIGMAGIITLVTLVIWAIRAGATVTRLTVRRGQLEIVRQGTRMVFDLASTYTAVEVSGKPGSKKWKVQFLRRGTPPVTVDETMVDGRDFMRILTFYRPDLAV